MSHILIMTTDQDHHMTDQLHHLLRDAGYEVTTEASGSKGRPSGSDRSPDLIVLHVPLPWREGGAMGRWLREDDITAPILMLPAPREMSAPGASEGAGVEASPASPGMPDELLTCIEALLGGAPGNPHESVRFADVVVTPATHQVQRGLRTLHLTATEYRLLVVFLGHPHQVLRRKVLMEAAWEYDFGEHSNVLDVYIGYLRTKLEAGGEQRLIQTVRGLGYVLHTSCEAAGL
jgi:two-component system, OmpR family, response regulator MprA